MLCRKTDVAENGLIVVILKAYVFKFNIKSFGFEVLFTLLLFDIVHRVCAVNVDLSAVESAEVDQRTRHRLVQS